MSSRSAAKKLSKPGKPARGSKSKAILAKGKPAKKPLAKVARFPKQAPQPKQPKGPRPAAQKPAALPVPPAPPRPPLLGLPPPAPHGVRPGAPARPLASRLPTQPSSRPPPLPGARPPLGKTPMPSQPPKSGILPPKKPLGMPELRSGPVQTTPARQSLARSFYWSELRVGDDLPPLNKPAVDRVQIARYAGAANDYNRLHLDEPFAHALGFPGTFAPGALAMGFVGQLLTSWLRRGHVRRLSARFIKFVWPGDELTCRGRIAELRKDGGACYADIELWAENRKGELVLRGQATCELYESPAAASSEGSGLLFALDQGAHGAARSGQAARPPQKPSSKPPPPAKPPPSYPPKKK